MGWLALAPWSTSSAIMRPIDGRQLEAVAAESDGPVQAGDCLGAVEDWVAVGGHVVHRAVAAQGRGGGEFGDAARRTGPEVGDRVVVGALVAGVRVDGLAQVVRRLAAQQRHGTVAHAEERAGCVVDHDGGQGLQGRRAAHVDDLNPDGADGQALAQGRGEPVGPGAGDGDDGVRVYRALFGVDARDAAARHAYAGDLAAGQDLGAVSRRLLREGVRGGDRVGVAGVGLVYAEGDAAGAELRDEPGDV